MTGTFPPVAAVKRRLVAYNVPCAVTRIVSSTFASSLIAPAKCVEKRTEAASTIRTPSPGGQPEITSGCSPFSFSMKLCSWLIRASLCVEIPDLSKKDMPCSIRS